MSSIIERGVNFKEPAALPSGIFVSHMFAPAMFTDQEHTAAISNRLGINLPRSLTPHKALAKQLAKSFPGWRGFLVRPLKNSSVNGLEVIRESKGTRSNTRTVLFSVRIQPGSEACTPVVETRQPDSEDWLIDEPSSAAIRQWVQCTDPSLATEWWVNFILLPHAKALRFFPTGGQYFVPEEFEGVLLETIPRLLDARCYVGCNRFVVQKMAMSPVTAQAALQCAQEQFAHELSVIQADLSKEGGLGEKALQTQTENLAACLEKIAKYRELLQAPLASLEAYEKGAKDAQLKAVSERRARAMEAQGSVRGGIADMF